MKYITSLALCAGVAFADKDQIAKDLEKLKANYTKTGQLRAFTGIVAVALEPIDEYGCWCWFGQLKGQGPPQNEVDQACKVLQQGYDCAILDGEDESQSCTPWEVSYQSGITVGGNSVEIECAIKNPNNNCAQRACVIEGNFVLTIFASFFSNIVFDPSLKHDKGTFNPATECSIAPANPIGGNDPADPNPPVNGPPGTPTIPGRECCGDYPVRAPYHPLNGAKDCCGTVVFNTADLKCCANDVLSLSC
jgi:hypothetical protein